MARSVSFHENGLPSRSMTVWWRFSTPDTTHGPFGLGKVGLPDAMAQLFAENHPTETICQLIVTRPAPNPGFQIVFDHTEQAGPNFAIRGNSQPVTMTAKRLGHRSDDTNLPFPVRK